ncbi:MAG: helix-turn-helix domain-containing protein [Chloroflexota bacterium]
MDDITLTPEEQRRSTVLARLLSGDLGIEEAAAMLGLSVRQTWRLKVRFLDHGAAGLVHGNRDRPSPRRIDDAIRERVIALARDPLLGGSATAT